MIDVKVGIPREVKNNEFRVAITPAGVHELVRNGHQVVVERNAGVGSSITDDEYVSAGAQILQTADEVWAAADLLLKVKEPIAEEYHRLRKDQTLFTYLHLAASKECTDALLESGTTAIAYETVELPSRALPLLAPMSEVAGRLAPQVGAYHLMAANGGRGVLPGGVPGVLPAKAVVIGGGVSGWNAAQIAIGMGFQVTLLDRDINKLKEADKIFGTKIQTVVSNAFELEKACLEADLVIGAVLIPGAKAPKLVTNELVSRMKAGSVLVDIAIDQGGCFEDSRPTTHAEPTFPVHNSVFYCVANMPGAVPNTSTYALTNATLPYIVELANRGWVEALRRDPALAKGLNTHDGKVVYREVAEALGLEHVELESLLG
ncbi:MULTISPECIES: alanine dehydrogenase [Streptomyces]|uniref:Alanine dehydrogenase n=1 Tax=Streptomyces mirabilis TaxID=68239 RepID=A0ABU3UX02_9ACTN|nr:MULTISPECIES: alanine dehydrogenase [Streptomyces]MCX4607719.1 alanine dehydrogenase [Streptomyces mirabilis]MCX5348182.1 alanine dehydrogenase [Streptomyces mirabilis]MDU8998459.1 alanine dehydrogenase [Streptomyces mirabilis]NMI57323.1 alanine dehydrogenase [Streptomyces sp. RLA2-12]SOE26662.1 L-alanine dehydrogenase [Streptomyces sp. OK228]